MAEALPSWPSTLSPTTQPPPTVKRAFAWTILSFGSALVAVKLAKSCRFSSSPSTSPLEPRDTQLPHVKPHSNGPAGKQSATVQRQTSEKGAGSPCHETANNGIVCELRQLQGLQGACGMKRHDPMCFHHLFIPGSVADRSSSRLANLAHLDLADLLSCLALTAAVRRCTSGWKRQLMTKLP